jgi:hypothetical protein
VHYFSTVFNASLYNTIDIFPGKRKGIFVYGVWSVILSHIGTKSPGEYDGLYGTLLIFIYSTIEFFPNHLVKLKLLYPQAEC